MATTIRNNSLFCDHCGQSFSLRFPIPIKDLQAKTKAFELLHKDCPKTWKEPEVDQSKNIKAKALFWFQNGQRGMSSKTMWFCCMNQPINRISYPYDPDDFSRCYKLLEMVPEWKSDFYMQKIALLSPVWSELIKNWKTLTEMYEENTRTDWKNYTKIGMYELMQKCIK